MIPPIVLLEKCKWCQQVIDRYQKARDILRSYTPEGKFPSLKSLQVRKTELLELQKAQSMELENLKKVREPSPLRLKMYDIFWKAQ